MNKGLNRFKPDLYDEGACIYLLDKDGEIESIAAWARNDLVAAKAFEALVAQYPNYSFSLRRRSFVAQEILR